MLSSAARAIWASVLPRVRPVMLPRASGFQYGAPRPVKAGTIITPPASGTLCASASIPALLVMARSPLRKRRLGLSGASARLGRQLRGAGGQQAVVRGLESGAQVHQHEAARAVG